MIHMWTADIYEGDMWSSQWISNLNNWNREAWKKIRASTGLKEEKPYREKDVRTYTFFEKQSLSFLACETFFAL